MAGAPDIDAAPVAIRLKDVTFSWPGRSGFTLGVRDLAIERGAKVFLVGESGSGKSTLLSLICGIARPQSGSVHLDGSDITRLSGPRRDRLRAEKVGLIFQMFNLLPYATPLDNVLLPLAFAPQRRRRLKGAPRDVALNLLRALGLPDQLLKHSAAAELSVGQQQRVAVARALIGEPPIIIADEPTSSLDASAQSAFLDVLFEQVDRAGVTLLMVSHDDRLGARFDRSLRLEDFAEISRGRPA